MADIHEDKEGRRQHAPGVPEQVEGERSHFADAGAVDLTSGVGLGKYRILERLRTTHNAVVYKARDMALDRLVAVKQMNRALIDKPIECGEFRREAQILARVGSGCRNLVNILELIEGDQGLFIVEEFAPGDTLEILISKRQIGAANAIQILRSACAGLRALHSRKIVHRDIRPENLIVGRSGVVRITSFGCAAYEGDHTAPPVASMKYAAPELLGGNSYDARVDLYALGMSLYEACVGRRALREFLSHFFVDPESDENWRTWHGIPTLSLPAATELNPAVPPALSSILAGLTAKNLDERTPTAERLVDLLDRRFRIRASGLVGGLMSNPSEPAFDRSGAEGDAFSHDAPIPGGLERREPSLRGDRIFARAPSGGQSTSTHVAYPLARTSNPPQEDAWSPEDNEGTFVQAAPSLKRVRSLLRAEIPAARYRSVSSLVIPPALSSTDEPRRHKRRRLLVPMILSSICLLTLIAAAPFVWEWYFRGPAEQQLKRLIADGHAAYRIDDFETARKRFEEAADISASDADFSSAGHESELMLLLAKGQLALESDEFDKVEKLLEAAENRGANPLAVDALRTRFWNKKDAFRLALESQRELEEGRFLGVEMKLDEYEQRARAAGLDPAALRAKLEQSRAGLEYDQALSRARQSLSEGDFQAALIAGQLAQRIQNTSEAHQLLQEIRDSKNREDLILRGDAALQSGDYAAAESAFLSANEIRPSYNIEQKHRLATSLRMVEEARADIERGELLNAERLLKSAMYKYPNPKAEMLLEGMRPSFEAAKLAHRAEQALEAGDPAEAIRLFEEAIPALPPPANEMAREKLARAKQAAVPPAE